MFSLRKLFLGFLVLVFVTNPAFAAFADIQNDELSPEVIEFLRSKKIGDMSNNFYPRRPVTIVEFLAMGFAAAGVKENDLPRNMPARFRDVTSEDWFMPVVGKAEELDILGDFRGEKLLPNRALNRGEAVKLGLAVFGVGIPPTLPEENFGFRDVRKSHRLARYIFRAVKMGVINPETDDKFGIMRRMNRAEAARLFYNIANFKEEGSTTIVINSGVSKISGWPLFERVWSETKGKFLFKENINEREMLHSALEGMIKSLNDPYSEFYSPAKTQMQTGDLSGEIEGIGVYIEKDPQDRGVLVVTPIFNSPAERAGLQPGDIIIAANGKSLVGLSLAEAASLTRGPAGTYGKYTILRGSMEFEVEILREKIKIDSISLEFRNRIAIVDINQFTSALPKDFAKIAIQIKKQHPRGIILDLRNNGGGLINSAVDLLGYFLPENAIVASQEFRPGLESKNIDYHTKRPPTLHGFRTIVLVNEGSASASEIVAAALQDHNVASIAGKQTFGKGTVQEISFFEDGSALKITVAHWLSPRKQPIQDKGVTPDFEAVDNLETPVDEALDLVFELF